MGERERLNYLDGKTWSRYSISVWDIVKTPGEARLGHPAMFPLKLCERLISIYTKVGDVVLDPFMGSGSVLVSAKKLGRKGIGLDVVPDFVELARKRLKNQRIEIKFSTRLTDFLKDENLLEEIRRRLEEVDVTPEVYCADARKLLEYVKPYTVDLCLTSPPYWNVHKRKRTADYKKPKPYSNLKNDLGNIENYGDFMEELAKVFRNVHKTLKTEKRCVIVAMDLRVGKEFIPFHVDLIEMMREIGFTLEDIIIWDRRREYHNLRPLGYPYMFVVNKVHEYILIFRKSSI